MLKMLIFLGTYLGKSKDMIDAAYTKIQAMIKDNKLFKE